MFKIIAGVIAGYAIFVITSIALFQLSRQKPHAPATLGFQIATAVYGIVFSALSGFVAQIIANSKSIGAALALAIVIAGFAAFSMVKSDGASWTQLLAIFLFAPAALLGGVWYQKRLAKV